MTNSEEPVQKLAERFEKQVIDWLRELGFKNVDGGRNFRVGDIQVDACGGHEDTLLVFECLMATKRSKQSIRRKIQALRGNMSILSKAFHKDDRYSKYGKLKYILITKNITLNEEDRRFAQQKPEMSIWDEQLMDYYMRLSKGIGTHARYNLLGEIGIEPRVASITRIPALQTRLENYILYLFFVEPQKLIQAAYVARREEGKERYYQRILDPARIGRIRRFINKGGLFPNNIIVAFNKPPKFVPFREVNSQLGEAGNKVQFGILNFPSNYRSCWIIDGQHRLYAFPEPLRGDSVAVAAFEKIKPERQAQFFIEINREQKPVDADLLWDLEGEMRPDHKEGIISNVVKKMNSLSPLDGRIYVPLEGKRKKGQLKFSGLCMSIQKRKLVEKVSATMEGAQKNPLYSTDAERTVASVSKALSAFFQQIGLQFNEQQKSEIVFTNGGISVMTIIFERILSRVGKTPSEEDLNKYVQALHSVIATQFADSAERKEFRLRANSEGGRTDLAQTLCLSMRRLIGR
jgi:DNA sulfur modification protein DndB